MRLLLLWSLPLSFTFAGCGGVWLETRAEVVSLPRAPTRVMAHAEGDHVATATLPGFERPPGSLALGALPGFEGGEPPEIGPQTTPIANALAQATVSPAVFVAGDAGRVGEARPLALLPERPSAAPLVGSARLGALVGAGVQIDGSLVRFGDLRGPLGLERGGGGAHAMSAGSAVESWAALDHETVSRDGGETQIVVRLRANPRLATSAGAPIRLHLVIDRSSSMQRSWAQMLEAASQLIAGLRPDDTLQIVAYGTAAIEALPLRRIGNGDAARRALAEISVGGGTHIEAGLQAAYRSAANAPRSTGLVILLSDGVPNHGAFEPHELGGLAQRAAENGTTTSAVGLGTQFDADVLARVARDGGGTYSVAEDLEELAPALIRETEARAQAVARDLSVRVALPSGIELIDAGGARVEGDAAVFAIRSLDAAQERRMVVRVRVPPSPIALEVARVQVSFHSAAGLVTGGTALSASVGPDPVRSGAPYQPLDDHLAQALTRVSTAVAVGDERAAASALNEHAARLEGRREHASHPGLRARARTARGLARALSELLPSATPGERRSVSLGVGSIAHSL